MKKILNVVMLLCAVSLVGCATTHIMNPESVACVNFGSGAGLTANEVIRNGKETVIHFTMNYRPKEGFRYGSDSYLIDEVGRRYALISADGIELDKWVKADSSVVNFTMHFEPLAKDVKVFDFVEGDVDGAFMLLGIRDKGTKLSAPSLQEISSANPYTVPDDWFRRDTVTLRGRIEGYDAEKFGFSTMKSYISSAFEGVGDPTAVLFDIVADGTFERRFVVNEPVQEWIRPVGKAKVRCIIPFWAFPGDTIDVTVRKDATGSYKCYYDGGRCKEMERLLKSNLAFSDIAKQFYQFDGKFVEIEPLAEKVWHELLWRVNTVAQREKFAPQEVQWALADMQVHYALRYMDYVMKYADKMHRSGRRNDKFYDEYADSAIFDVKRYVPLHYVDFDNPMLLSCQLGPALENRLQYSRPVRAHYWDSTGYRMDSSGVVILKSGCESEMQSIKNIYRILREMMGSEGNTLMAQLCVFNHLNSIDGVMQHFERQMQQMSADTTLAEEERQKKISEISSVTNMRPLVMATFTHPYVRLRADDLFDKMLVQEELTELLSGESKAADFIYDLGRKNSGKYLLIDFWGMTCGPCRMEIERSRDARAKIEARGDVKVVFITSEHTNTSSEAYQEYVKKWMLDDEEVICLPETEYVRFQELFQFNGNPQYELITPDMRRVRAELRPYEFSHFEPFFNQLKAKLE